MVLSSFTFFSATAIKFYPYRSVGNGGLLTISIIAIGFVALICSNFFLPDFEPSTWISIFFVILFLVIFIVFIRCTHHEWTERENEVKKSHENLTGEMGEKLEALRKKATQ